tara:strand:+ start:20763 stop:21371 length:609 start_codon:yes stop_codon:yes gene_type:complete
MENKYAPLEADSIYHVYNQANGDERLLRIGENYAFFLRQYQKYIHPFAETFSYCLMPNHFHFLIQIKNEQSLKDLPGFQNLTGLDNKKLSNFISKQFSNLFNSNTKAFNKMYQRKGSLFMKPFKRKKIEDEAYLKKLIHYIHYNPVEAALVKLPVDWKYSSYKTIISSYKTSIKRNEVIALFEDKQNFIYCHKIALTISRID